MSAEAAVTEILTRYRIPDDVSPVLLRSLLELAYQQGKIDAANECAQAVKEVFAMKAKG